MFVVRHRIVVILLTRNKMCHFGQDLFYDLGWIFMMLHRIVVTLVLLDRMLVISHKIVLFLFVGWDLGDSA